MRRTEALKIITRVLRQPDENVPAADLIYGAAADYFREGSSGPQPWAMQVDMLALRIAAQLPLTADAESSPLQLAEDAKRRRDLGGELAALQQGHDQLTSAPWYPVRPGDLVHVHYEAGGEMAAYGETYIVGPESDGLMGMQLLAHTLPDATDNEGMVGCLVVDAADDPLYELWFEAGPHRLTIVRDGRPVHAGGGGNR
ncbi:hypothetical protein [Streptomyces sp. NPDC087437]|uniref:hypothetical protein n=1 Tax=Streptomyces sp. NPDC087437 TaxID=3365789 RepID=UPI0037FF6E2C